MNNPLLFTDPSGYRPQALFEEEERMERNSATGSWNPFGWINNYGHAGSVIDWTMSNAWTYWALNIQGNEILGEEASKSFFHWYQNRDNQEVNWDIAFEMGMEFLNTDYQYGGNDIFYTNSDGRSGYLRSYLAVLVDQIIDRAIISEMQSLGQSPRGYGMMLGDPQKDPLIPGIYETSWKNLGYQLRRVDRILEGNTFAKDDPSNVAAQKLLKGAAYTIPSTGVLFGFSEAISGKDPTVPGSEPSQLNRYKGVMHISIIFIPINRATATTQLLIYSSQDVN